MRQAEQEFSSSEIKENFKQSKFKDFYLAAKRQEKSTPSEELYQLIYHQLDDETTVQFGKEIIEALYALEQMGIVSANKTSSYGEHQSSLINAL